MADEELPSQLSAMADLFTPIALRVAATLHLADHLAQGADSVGALAERTRGDPDALGRLADHLVAIGALQRGPTGALSLTDLGEQLREGHAGGARAWLDIEGATGRADLSALHLLDAVRSGRPAYPQTYGREFWEDLAARESAASIEMGLRMLAYTGGRERSLAELGRLAADAGLRAGASQRVTQYRSVTELRA
ncbi:MAG TPA: hypothetical protein VHX88_09670 [Solirubrobacteraceae bacterium]|nr:hypothetical protein [Solirubrobacteraceae bacterium]